MALLVFALVWLAVCMVYDLRYRALPSWLTLPPLAVAAIWATLQGNVAIVVFALSLVAFDDLPDEALRLMVTLQLIVLTIYGGVDSASLPLTYGVFFIWLAWKKTVIGGADAKVLMTLLFVFGSGPLFPISYMAGVQALVQWLRKKPTFPAMLAVFAGFTLHVATLL